MRQELLLANPLVVVEAILALHPEDAAVWRWEWQGRPLERGR